MITAWVTRCDAASDPATVNLILANNRNTIEGGRYEKKFVDVVASVGAMAWLANASARADCVRHAAATDDGLARAGRDR